MRKAFLFLFLICLALTSKAESIKSPNGNLELNFIVKEGIPTYQLTYKNKPVINESKLGIELKEGLGLMKDFTLTKQP